MMLCDLEAALVKAMQLHGSFGTLTLGAQPPCCEGAQASHGEARVERS